MWRAATCVGGGVYATETQNYSRRLHLVTADVVNFMDLNTCLDFLDF